MAKLLQFPTLPAETEKPANPKGKSALTELRIEKLPVTGATYYVQDGAQPGLSVRVSAGGVKAFIFTKHQHGRLTRITLGRVGAMRLDAARKAAQKLHGELAMGVDIGAAHKTKRDAPVEETMQQAFERFLTLKTRRASTTGDYQSIWRLHIPANLKRKAVKDVTAADIEDVKRTAGKKPPNRQSDRRPDWCDHGEKRKMGGQPGTGDCATRRTSTHPTLEHGRVAAGVERVAVRWNEHAEMERLLSPAHPDWRTPLAVPSDAVAAFELRCWCVDRVRPSGRRTNTRWPCRCRQRRCASCVNV